MQAENDALQIDNERLARSNVQYEGLVTAHEAEIQRDLKHASGFGDKIAKWDGDTMALHRKEVTAAKLEKKLDRDMSDLIEYTKWITLECEKLRDRVRASERVINDLRTSGEASVESLMESLYLLKIRAEEMDAEASSLREMINTKEVLIKRKEEEKGEIKATIEIENADRENEIQALRNQLAEQNALLDSQRKQLNELQVRCEFTQSDMIRGNRELLKKKQQKKQLTLQYQEVDQATVTLKNQHGLLEADYKNKMTILKGALAPPGLKKPEDQALEQPPGTNFWGKPIAPALKTRSNNAMFSGETVFQK